MTDAAFRRALDAFEQGFRSIRLTLGIHQRERLPEACAAYGDSADVALEDAWSAAREHGQAAARRLNWLTTTGGGRHVPYAPTSKQIALLNAARFRGEVCGVTVFHGNGTFGWAFDSILTPAVFG